MLEASGRLVSLDELSCLFRPESNIDVETSSEICPKHSIGQPMTAIFDAYIDPPGTSPM